MKKNQTKCNSKAMKGKGNDVARTTVRVHEPRHEGHLESAHGKIEAAFADLKNEYKKSGQEK